MIIFPLLSCGGREDSHYIRVSEHTAYFEYSNGEPFIPIGPNICWERFEKEETAVLDLYEQRFKTLSGYGGNYTRIWLSAPFFEIEHAKAGEYDEQVALRIDKLLESASRYGIKIKFCLENFRKLTGQPAPFSTSVPYDKPIYAAEGMWQSMDDYFRSETGRELYLNRIRFLAGRYANHPSVFGWELWNEINSVSAGRQVIYEWTVEMLPAVKALFPNHLVMQSLGSFDRESSRETYKFYMEHPANEVAQVHRYLDPGASWVICREAMDTLASHSIYELREYIHEKPILLSEVGAVEANHAGPSLLYESDSLGVLLHDMLFAPFFSGAAGPGQNWHWSYYIEKHNLWWHYGRFAKAVERINPIKEMFRPAYFCQDDIRYYILRGNEHTLIWCRDKNSNWKTEFIEKTEPDVRETLINLHKVIEKNIRKISLYDPWKDETKGVDPSVEYVMLTFKRSLVIHIEHTSLQ
jgi:hypothetical protein